jgi:hypothetical protein
MPQGFLGPAEGALAIVEVLKPRDDPTGALLDAPAAQVREAIEQPVENEDTEEQLGRVVDSEVVLRAHVLATAEVIGDWHVVVVKRRVEQPPAAADVQYSRTWAGTADQSYVSVTVVCDGPVVSRS